MLADTREEQESTYSTASSCVDNPGCSQNAEGNRPSPASFMVSVLTLKGFSAMLHSKMQLVRAMVHLTHG